ncbi:MAG TPA: hypothetical protein VHM23_19575 [Actinomycetota bacterium]|nr:hypothetical protein [Actinomycetota bacterium]
MPELGAEVAELGGQPARSWAAEHPGRVPGGETTTWGSGTVTPSPATTRRDGLARPR